MDQLGEAVIEVGGDAADLGGWGAFWVDDGPAEVALARVDGACVAASEGDHDVGGADDLAGERLGDLAGEVEPESGGDGDDAWVELR
ncbi:hypothetical protein [Spirillospora sp. NPDC047279]|uniref:hypothetical protein n=1 Tax=Spirillospora sp. NPDC047279 TaxID=3155478 RepID=UPI0033DC1DFA